MGSHLIVMAQHYCRISTTNAAEGIVNREKSTDIFIFASFTVMTNYKTLYTQDLKFLWQWIHVMDF